MAVQTDPRDIVTPDAFELDKRLLNRPLASPWRRAVALLIDLLVVAMVTGSGGLVFVLLVLLTWRIRRRQWRAGTWAMYLLYFLLAASLIPPLYKAWQGRTAAVEGDPQALSLTLSDVGSSTWALIQLELCADLACMAPHFPALAGLSEPLSLTERRDLADELLDNLAGEERVAAQAQLAQVLALDDEPAGAPVVVDPSAAFEAALAQEKRRSERLKAELSRVKEQEHSPLTWLKGTLKDLGLGFGLAAFYFTCFVAWFDGQTVGKKLLRCRVRQLDGTPLSLWDAFGRYGGYSAGLATGLLGFAQILWDPNRQAIHDKISATVVEDVRARARLKARQRRRQR
ncbi:RDD family protein [Ferrimonas pelagia]|uniref:RDD family protein n=1 Tax=Ferrimonas pelagia TaxID=1177826 RepID=A0ABP9EW14_9GAMM